MSDTFPIDWTEWNREWNAWKARHADKLHRTSLRAPGKNFLADDIIGTYGITYGAAGTAVELSEVTMPDFRGGYGADRKRFVGITYVHADGSLESGGVVESFEQLEAALDLEHATA